jgi:hypothetical protein
MATFNHYIKQVWSGGKEILIFPLLNIILNVAKFQESHLIIFSIDTRNNDLVFRENDVNNSK